MPFTFRRLIASLLLSLCGAALLPAQPVNPTAAQIQAVHDLAYPAGAHRTAAASTPFTVNTANREEVRQFYRSIYFASEGVSMGWTGNYTASDPVAAAGDTTAAFKEAVRVRINFFRAMAGVPAAITLNSAYSAKNQQAALMMSANNALNHFPPNTWTYYTADGYSAAGNSNLAYGSSGPDAITGYMADSGSNNAAVGHRRWLYYPQTLLMGTGDVAGDGNHYPANTVWVIDDQFNQARPATRTAYVSYPAAGYVPYTLVWPRWSFSYPGADFSAATVAMTRNGTPIATTLETISSGAGENTLAWVYDGLPADADSIHPKPTSDTVYNVTVANVKINNAPQSFTYTVTVFDPDTAGGDYAPTTVTLPSSIPVGQATPCSVTAPAYASHFEVRSLQFAAFAKIFNAENGLDGITAQTGGYATVVNSPQPVGAGTASYHLAKTDIATLNETLTLPGTFYAATNQANLTYLSRLGYASAQQSAHVQIALDDGTGWFDLSSQAGTDGPGETAYTTKTISLAAYAGRTFRLRFLYHYVGTGNYFPQADPNIGWYLDNIAVNGVQSVTAGPSTVNPTSSVGSVTPPVTGSLGVQARGLFFGTYPMEWGPVVPVTVSNGPAITTQPQGHTVTTGSTVVFNVAAAGTGLTYQWRKAGIDIAGATSPRLVLTDVQAPNSGDYTVAVGNGSVATISSAATLSVSASANPGRLVNLSVRGFVGTGNQVLIMGFVTGGDGTSGNTSLLARAVGPSVIPLGVTDAITDPTLVLIPRDAPALASNDNWGGTTALKNAFAATGAFALLSDSSKDAALVQDFPRNVYSIVISDTAGATGSVVAELYDAGAALPYNPATPRLVNISARGYIGANGSIIPGFVIQGDTALTVLVRAIGPNPDFATALGSGNIPDPILYLYHAHDGTSDTIYVNDNWGGDPQLTAVGNRVGASPLSDPASKDAAILITLDPGVYSAGDFGVNGATGITLVEVYAVP